MKAKQTVPSYAYILTNKPNGVLYVGSTTNLLLRLEQHKIGKGSEFTDKYNVIRLVWIGEFDSIMEARDMERRLKNWRRDWKVNLIEEANPNWEDLSLKLNL